MATGDVYHFRLICQYFGNPVVYSFSIEFQSDIATPYGFSLIFDESGGVLDTLLNRHATGFNVIDLQYRKVVPELGVVTSYGPTHVNGTLGMTTTAMQCAVLCSLRTGEGGRARRGRMYLMCFGGGDLNASGVGTWNVTPMTRAADIMQKMKDHFGPAGTHAANYRWTIWSRRYNFSTRVIDVTVHNEIATVRRRSLRSLRHSS